MQRWRYLKKVLLLALKIGVGSSAAIYAAAALGLENTVSAGTIALLTVMTTKWEMIRISAARLVTFAVTVVVAWGVFLPVNNAFLAYGIFAFITVLVAEIMGWRATISVNAVIGAHLLISHDFSAAYIRNEFEIVVIGSLIAFILNLFQDNHNRRKDIILNMRYVENRLQTIMGELADYLLNKEMQRNVWEDICALEKQIRTYIKEACEYQDNTFQSHFGYYISYFEMRYEQCRVLASLHDEMGKIRSMPKQARIVAEYVIYLMDYVVEVNSPEKQMEELNRIFERMRREELPRTRGEFESRAMLYHILMDIEEFLMHKARFVKQLDDKQREIFWKEAAIVSHRRKS